MTKERNIAPVRREYARLASRYDTRWSHYVDVTTDVTIENIGPLSREAVLDVGCGTGALLATILRKYPDAKLAGIDLSQDMLAIAGKAARALGINHSPFLTAGVTTKSIACRSSSNGPGTGPKGPEIIRLEEDPW